MFQLRSMLLLSLVLTAVAISPAGAEVRGPYLGGPQPDPPGIQSTKKGPVGSRSLNPQSGTPLPGPQ